MKTVSAPLSVDQISEYVRHAFRDVHDDVNWGERALFYNPGRRLPKGVYFLTFKEKDGANDRASRIAPGEYRLNFGISRQAFTERFGAVPARPPAGGVIDSGHDFTLSDRLTPHPVYGWMCWVAVKNPSAGHFDGLKPLLAEAYRNAGAKFEQRVAALSRAARRG